ncbi:MAG: hypothetical protein LBK50_00140 [Candidatus Nomurabacteria bacterium]|jgi:hypothetical protein|nr:hypothetical protein [Candidatus Nomurabacteria bacterium]
MEDLSIQIPQPPQADFSPPATEAEVSKTTHEVINAPEEVVEYAGEVALEQAVEIAGRPEPEVAVAAGTLDSGGQDSLNLAEQMEADINSKVSTIEHETERKIQELWADTYKHITEQIGLSEYEAIEMIGEDKMNKILGEEKVGEIKSAFEEDVVDETTKILQEAYQRVGLTLDDGVKKLVRSEVENYKKPVSNRTA